MNADTVDKIADLTRQAESLPLTSDITLQNGQAYTYEQSATQYGRELGKMVMPPRPTTLAVTTLTGFADAIPLGGYDANACLVHVEDYLTVSLKARAVDTWGHRAVHVMAKHIPIEVFRFDSYYTDPQKFIIALQVGFLVTDELLYLIRLASNLKAGNSVQTEDDGYRQTVTLKTGEITTAEAKVPPRIKLIPLRTFNEADPVVSEFLVRLQQTPQQTPSIALFDVDGRKWHGELMQSIKTWLSEKIDKALPIIA